MNNEKARIDRLLADGKITADDHRALSEALTEARAGKSARRIRFIEMLLHPSAHLSAATLMMVAAVATAMAVALGVNLQASLIGPLDFQVLRAGSPTATWPGLLAQNLLDILVLAAVFDLGARAMKAKNLREIDFLAVAAIGRVPYAVLALYLAFGAALNPSLLPRDPSAVVNGWAALWLASGAFIALLWILVVLFSGLKDASGLSGRRLWGIYIAGLFLAELIVHVVFGFIRAA